MRIRVRSTGEIHHPKGSYCVTLETAKREASYGWEASHDPVTALPTRPVLLDMLKEEGLTPDSPPLAILLVDLDRFRDVNVLLGHDGGDRVLMLALRRIREALGPVEGIFRLDGNTFCAVIRCGDPEATMAGDQLVEVFKAPITETQPVITVGCSVGISVAPQDGTRGTSCWTRPSMPFVGPRSWGVADASGSIGRSAGSLTCGWCWRTACVGP